jgi:hypothetical protein
MISINVALQLAQWVTSVPTLTDLFIMMPKMHHFLGQRVRSSNRSLKPNEVVAKELVPHFLIRDPKLVSLLGKDLLIIMKP